MVEPRKIHFIDINFRSTAKGNECELGSLIHEGDHQKLYAYLSNSFAGATLASGEEPDGRRSYNPQYGSLYFKNLNLCEKDQVPFFKQQPSVPLCRENLALAIKTYFEESCSAWSDTLNVAVELSHRANGYEVQIDDLGKSAHRQQDTVLMEANFSR